MFCRNCNRSNREANRFCVYCGAALAAGAGAAEPAADFSRELSLPELQAEVERLSAALDDVRAVLARRGIDTPAHPTPPREPQPAAPSAPKAHVWPTREPEPAPAAAQPARAARAALWDRIEVDWELILGGNWLARVGILAVIIGVAFFLKLAFDNDWIGEAERVVLGVAGGIALLGVAEYLRARYPLYAQTLTGGGIAVLYLSIFAAFSFYGFLHIYAATGLLFVISALAALAALRYNSVALAVIGIVGAFTAPFILGAFGDAPEPLEVGGLRGAETMIYVIIVDLAVLALSTVRNWRWFTLLALGGSLASFGIWHAGSDADIPLAVAHGSLTAMFLIFVGATTLFHFIWKRSPKTLDQSLMIVNAVAYFGISYGLLWDELSEWMGLFSASMALFYAGLAALAVRRSRRNVHLGLTAVGLALVFLTVAVPAQLDGPWIGVTWAAEGAMLFWLSFRLRRAQLRLGGSVVFALSVVRLLGIDTPEALEADLTPFYNEYVLPFAMAAAAFLLAAFLVRIRKHRLTEYERELFPILLGAATLLVAVGTLTQVDGPWIAFAWGLEALALVWISVRFGLREPMALGAAMFAAAAVRLLAYDTPVDLDNFRLVLNMRMLAFASVVAALYLAALLAAWDRREYALPVARYVALGFVAAANFLTLWALSAECIAAVDGGIVDVADTAGFYAKSLGLSLIWAVYASLGLVVGIVGRWRTVRLASLGLLAVPIFKLFLFDSLALEQGYRVAAFLSLGLILLVLGFLYQRYGEAIRGFLFEESPAAGDA